jgi:hypothetical protein
VNPCFGAANDLALSSALQARLVGNPLTTEYEAGRLGLTTAQYEAGGGSATPIATPLSDSAAESSIAAAAPAGSMLPLALVALAVGGFLLYRRGQVAAV